MNGNIEKAGRPKRMSSLLTLIAIGIVGGFIFSLLSFVAFYFNFSELSPAFILTLWKLGSWKNNYIGQLVAMSLIALFSVGIAFLYKVCFEKIPGIWPGILFGLLLWVIVFHLANPFIPQLKPVKSLDLNTVVTSFCLFVSYGLFIGYSLSYAYIERKEVRLKER